MLCLRMDIDIWEVIAGASTKPFSIPFIPGWAKWPLHPG